MSTTAVFTVTPHQAARLKKYIQAYRRHVFMLLPSRDRNATLRALQIMLAKVIAASAQKTPIWNVFYTHHEMATLRAIVCELLRLYDERPATEERVETATDLAQLLHRLDSY